MSAGAKRTADIFAIPQKGETGKGRRPERAAVFEKAD